MKKKICVLLGTLLCVICLTGCLKTKAIIYEDYQGPILPLSATTDAENVSVKRNVKVDYSYYSYDEDKNRIIKVSDQYILKNTSNEDVTLELVYGYPRAYSSKKSMVPKMKVEGESVESELVIGRIPLRYGMELNKRGYFLDSREKFEELLKDGTYQMEAFDSAENVPTFAETTTVYKFEELGYTGEDKEIQNPGVGIFFDYNPEKTEIYCYGIDTYTDKNEKYYLEFGIPANGSTKDAYIIVVGDEIDIQDIKCYRHRMSDKELEGFTLEYKKYKSTFDEVLSKIVDENKAKHNILLNSSAAYEGISKELILNAGKQYIADMKEFGYNQGKPVQLEGYLFEPMGGNYVFYQTAQVVVPANDSLSVAFDYDKYTGIKRIDDTPYDGLEIMTTLGSNLKFQKQTLEVIGLDQAIISDYTTGDKIENGQTKVEMNDDYFEIYVEVSEREYRNGTQRIW